MSNKNKYVSRKIFMIELPAQSLIEIADNIMAAKKSGYLKPKSIVSIADNNKQEILRFIIK